MIANIITNNRGGGAKLSKPDNYIARNTFQNNATGAVGEAIDDIIARGEQANIFLLDSGEVDETGVTHGDARRAETWTQEQPLLTSIPAAVPSS